MQRRFVARGALSVAGAALLAAAAGGASSPAAGAGQAAAPCERLLALELPDTTITAAERVPAGSFTPPGGAAPVNVPAFCRAAGRTAPAIHFEVWLPQAGWNGKFQGIGNGGMAGSLYYDRLAAALARGYAAAATDTGHVTENTFDATWALGRPDLVADFGHRALHLTTVNAKAITEAYYGAPPEYSYYVGCSKGGQQGLMEAQRYPDDYDGIIAGNPAHDWTRFYAGAHLWYAQATLADPESYLPADRLPLLANAVNAACDALDGIEDGVLDDPRRCRFDPAELTCAAGQDPATCLTGKQVDAVRAIWSGSRNRRSEPLYPGLVPGGEAAPGGWARWVTGDAPFTSLHWLAAEGFFRHMVFEDPDWDFRSFDYDEDLAFALEKVGRDLDAADPDLRPLRDRGGKLIVYHGWSDADISPLGTIDYYEDVVALIGAGDDRATALASTRDFFRLFMAPGMGHCRGGPGPDRFDALTALERWVELGEAPARIVASRVRDGAVDRTRPLCPYPEVARWNGRGSTDEAGNFACAPPSGER